MEKGASPAASLRPDKMPPTWTASTEPITDCQPAAFAIFSCFFQKYLVQFITDIHLLHDDSPSRVLRATEGFFLSCGAPDFAQ
jgi:hypothetical protein